MDLEKRVDLLEIYMNEWRTETQKHSSILEEIRNFAKIQIQYAERMEKRVDRIENRLELVEKVVQGVKQEIKNRFENLEKGMQGILNYLQNPPKNGH